MGCGLADVALMVGYETQVYEQGGFFYYSPPLHVFPFRSDFEPVNLEDGCMLSCLDDIIQF
ncbi:unnamed protein product [Cuscuta europaea]|uniref:Uncharacterized protein n=1 Tax=Cuscuta europaea TaxID=41803 RepID=A0A9P0Z262_CUSEU|nr:unnamed protein product [Cuscuta europaea]CAH9084006.1 unnamed protein product [Cuscuta europaea]